MPIETTAKSTTSTAEVSTKVIISRPRIYGSVSGFQHSHSASLVHNNIHPLFCIPSARSPTSHVSYPPTRFTRMQTQQPLTTAEVALQVCFRTAGHTVMLQPLWFYYSLVTSAPPHPSYAFSVTYILPLLGVVFRDELVFLLFRLTWRKSLPP